MNNNLIWIVLAVVVIFVFVCGSNKDESFEEKTDSIKDLRAKGCYHPECPNLSCKPGYTLKGVSSERCFGGGGCAYGNKYNLNCICCPKELGWAPYCPGGAGCSPCQLRGTC